MSSDVLHNIQWLAVWQPCLACNATSGHSAGLFLQEKQDKEKVHKDRQRTLSLSVNLFWRGTHKLSWGCKERVLVSSWTDKAFLYPRLCSSVYTVAWWWPGPSAICHGAPCFCPLSVPMFSLDNCVCACVCACISSCMCVCVCVCLLFCVNHEWDLVGRFPVFSVLNRLGTRMRCVRAYFSHQYFPIFSLS